MKFPMQYVKIDKVRQRIHAFYCTLFNGVSLWYVSPFFGVFASSNSDLVPISPCWLLPWFCSCIQIYDVPSEFSKPVQGGSTSVDRKR